MLGIKLNPRQFLDRVAEELSRIDETEVQALADAVWECYEHGRTVFLCWRFGEDRIAQRRQRLERLPLLRGPGQGIAHARGLRQ